MFVYCNNNPVVYSDSTGGIPTYATMMADSAVTSDEVKKEMKKYVEQSKAQSLVAKTDLSVQETDEGTEICAKLDIGSGDTLAVLNEGDVAYYYSCALASAIEEYNNSMGGSHIVPTSEHIYLELQAHIVVWEVLKHQSCECVDINPTERRIHVVGIMFGIDVFSPYCFDE